MHAETKIHRQLTISTILAMFPDKARRLARELSNAGLSCAGCNSASYETLEGGMYSHGKTDEEINRLVERLNALLDEKVDPTTITLTPEAAKKFLEFTSLEGKQGWGLKFDEEMAGCSGFEYVLDFKEKADADDEVFVSQGIEIYVKKSSVPRLKGAQIDYVSGIRDSGFEVVNPNVRSSCGCGHSHGYH
jgi:iron-sulfur cluster assembly accessory protein